MELNIPEPNEALTAFLVGARCDEILHEIGAKAVPLYQATVAKRTGALAASARFHTEIGGARNDRHVGVMTVGDGLAYGAAHQFGHWEDESNRFGSDLAEGESSVFVEGAHDLNRVLEELGSL